MLPWSPRPSTIALPLSLRRTLGLGLSGEGRLAVKVNWMRISVKHVSTNRGANGGTAPRAAVRASSPAVAEQSCLGAAAAGAG